MSRFEVYIPHSAAGSPDMTLHVQADNWLMALAAGRKKMGEQGELGSNIICDFADDGSVHVTDPVTHRVFRILELPEAPAAPAPAPAPSAARPAAPAPAPAPSAARPAAPPPAPAPSAARPAAPAPAPAAPKTAPKTAPAPVEVKAQKIEARVEVAPAPAAVPAGPIGRTEKTVYIEDALANIFQSMMDLWEKCKTKQDVANYMVDIALKEIKAESAGFLFCDMTCDELSFLAARGPKAAEVMKHKVPLGAGIVGFCVQSGVSLSISEVAKDPRWYDRISKSLGYPTKSLMCAVVQHDGQSLGAIELINKAGSSAFSTEEVHILNYIAHEAGEAIGAIMDQEFIKKIK